MTPGNITEDLVHALVSGSHAEGIVGLHVAAAVEHRRQVLLIACDDDELDPSFELPLAAVLPGEHLLDALCRCLAAFGLTVARITGYLGHHDRDNAGDYARAFCFTVTVTNAVCHAARIGHEWVDLDDLAGFPSSARPHLIELSTWPPMPWLAPSSPVRASVAPSNVSDDSS